MIKRRISKSNSYSEDNVFWITMTDLLLGLAIIFITLFVLAMTGFTQSKMREHETQSQVAQELSQKLQAENIDVQVDKMTGLVKISDLELFELNSFELSPKGKAFLDKFLPIYVDTIFSNSKMSDKVANVLIQGHTDSQIFSGVSSKEEQFRRNMNLSLKRANAVADYIFVTKYNRKYTDKLTKILVVEGKSFTEPVIINGKEDFDKSRRVELKLVVKDSDFENFFAKLK